MIEEWMLADFEGAAKFFRLRPNLVRDAQRSAHPKRALLQAVYTNGQKTIKQRLVREGIRPGPEFQTVYAEFAEVWNIDDAIKNSESLRRAHAALQRALI